VQDAAASAAASGSAFGDAGADDDTDVRGFLFGRLAARRPELSAELATFRDELLAAAASDDGALKVWDMKDLGVQAAARIAGGTDPLRLLADVTASFPALAASLSRTRVNASLADELEANARSVRAGTSVLTINGAPLDPERTDAFSLLTAVAWEARFAAALAAVPLPAHAVRALARLTAPAAESVRVDWRGAPAVWANDVTKDAQFARWPKSLRGLLSMRFPGRLPAVRQNLFVALLVGDPASDATLASAEAVAYYLANGVSIRFGLLPCPRHPDGGDADCVPPPDSDDDDDDEDNSNRPVDPEVSRRVARLFASLEATRDGEVAWSWLSAASSQRRMLDPATHTREGLTWPDAERALAAVLGGREPDGAAAAKKLAAEAAAADDADEASATLAARVRDGVAWARSRGVARPPLLLFNGVVLSPRDTGGQTLDYSALVVANQEAQTMTEALYFGKLSDDADAMEWVLRDAVPSYNLDILSPATPPERLSLRAAFWAPGGVPASLRYVRPPGAEDAVAMITHWVVADVGSAPGRAVAAAAASAMAGGAADAPARVAFVHSGGSAPLLARAVLAATRLPSRRGKVAPFLASLLVDDAAIAASGSGDEAAFSSRLTALADAAGLRGEALAADLASTAAEATAALAAQAAFAASGALGRATPSSTASVVTNGRVTPLSSAAASALQPSDLSLLDAVELRDGARAVAPIVEAALTSSSPSGTDLEEDDAPAERISAAIAAAGSMVASRNAGAGDTSRGGPQLGDMLDSASLRHCGVVHAPAGAEVTIEGFLDPLSAEAQRLAPLLLMLRDALGDALAVRLALNPARDLADLPLKTYYRFAAPPVAAPLAAAAAPAAHFGALPPSRTLTLGAHVPDAWLVRAVTAPYDLDNLRLEDLGAVRGFGAELELESLLVTGHASESGARGGEPPRGVQLTLASSAPDRAAVGSIEGTIVMSNLGYFQLKAAPGVHTLAVAPGRSRQLYGIVAGGISDLHASSATLAAAPLPGVEAEGGLPSSAALAVGDFAGRTLRLQLRKRPGMEHADVLAPLRDGSDDDDERGGGIWGRAKGWLAPSAGGGSGKAVAPVGEDNSKIHIFSVASGHLYERFLKIMVLSVLRHTKTPAKFWFIKNYMSPGFADFLPLFAARYGFEYELITYKWPTWLNKQTEKQRIIWAYKVLFLDVLFPLTLKKVIFVDADQIVRTDMKTLMDLDLKGAPLGYTPMCDNAREMDGFRFWKQGFWRDHLRGKPYHISALYVVDLAAFRASAAGDQFRILYDSLSKDPNSLANLDQDLPNYAQHQVPIFSLPQEWLWCESWCGNATKAAAKTIDLCNNPMTKEPKLQGARRIVAEWTALDDEARAFTASVDGEAVAAEAPAPTQEGSGDAPHTARADASEL
jgi:UDP-glucose:glycoprotein glucosyltransferase